MDWTIHGDKGTIRITSPSVFVQIGYDEMKIEIQDGEGGKAETVEIPGDEFDVFKHPARNVGRVYKLLAEGNNSCTFEDAVKRHELIAGMYQENGLMEN